MKDVPIPCDPASDPVLDESGVASSAQVQPDRRQGKSRLSLLIRSAKVITELGEFVCIIRDVSVGGVRLSFFHELPEARSTQLELANGNRLPIALAWGQGLTSGFRFLAPVDVTEFIAEAGIFPKRSLRIGAAFPATLTADSGASAVTVRNISRQGARIESHRRLAMSQKVRLDAPGWPSIFATVCWRKVPDYGLIFRQMFSLEDFAQRAAAIQFASGKAERDQPLIVMG